ncbi:pitrilysin family protein [Actibacterium sp. 188UL27-1]|uniref:M16 family metallopeptidase n=1 Tax=Actibacterium sp. 188UL27-1 TaxID=2786961 RepID=UPI00195E3F09|nr:pitrilysin family protein [Actibacterium sp. 188UL27-1]MBM7068505.1 insulinase family protein [Actibacterium sp. 188UL27-1]
MIRIFLICAAVLGATTSARAAVDIQEVTSPGGITAWLVNEPSIPFVALEIRFSGGTSLDAPGKRGAVNLMAGLLEEGAADLSAREFAAKREELAASIRYQAYDDAISISAKFLTDTSDEAVELLRASLVEPSFDDASIERVRAQVLSGIESDAKDPEEIAANTFDNLAFGDHPYGSNPSGTKESVNALTRDDLVDAHARVLARDRIYVAAVGDISAEQLGAMLDQLFGELPAEGAPFPKTVDFGLTGGITVVPYDTPQSVVTFGQDGIARDDPDFFQAYLLMQVLGGGGYKSRLMEEVRVKRGLTYGIAAYLAPKDFANQLRGGVSTDNSRVAETIDVIKTEWQKLADDGLSAVELERVKTFLTGAYPLRFDGNARIASILVGMQMEDLGLDYVNTRNAKVDAVTIEEIDAIIKRMIDPEGLHFVVVGQPEGLPASN